ncbi:MAG: hypothetical protein ABI743_06595, partial [bacterium]
DLGNISGSGDEQWFLRPSLDEFARLHQLVTCYSYDTEYTADPEQSTDVFQFPSVATRFNFNTIQDDSGNPFFSTFRLLSQQIGRRRAQALLRWRDGTVDLNGDGDLDDDYILQPNVDYSIFNGDASAPHSQFTYHERNNRNFQDPAAADDAIYPRYLNIPDMGSILAVPYNEPSTVLYATSVDSSFTNSQVVQADPTGGNPIPTPVPNTNGAFNGDGAMNGDLDPVGGARMLYFEGGTDGQEIDVPTGNNKVAMGAGVIEGIHPSFAKATTFFPGLKLFVYQDTSVNPNVVAIADAIAGTQVTPLPDGDGVPGLPAMVIDGGSPLDAIDLAGPDWNPSNGFEMAYADGSGITIDTTLPDVQVQGDIYRYRLDIPLPAPAPVTNFRNDGTEGGFYPDYTPDGEDIVFSHVDLTFFNPGNPPTFGLNQCFNLSTVNVASGTVTRLNVTYPDAALRLAFHPVFSPDGDRIAFTGIEFDPFTGTFSSDLWICDATGGPAIRVTNTPNDNEIYPIFNEGLARVARQSDTATGNTRGVILPYPPGGITPTNTAANRVLLAGIIGEASVAFRDNDTSGLGTDQNWRERDLPVVPQHVVDPFQILSDELAFHNPRDSKDAVGPGLRLQAYPGRININTAPRPVLRALFLAMFQGARPVIDSTGLSRPGSSTPRIDDGLFPSYIVLPDPDTDDLTRFKAIKIADQYAHQVVEYRKWRYNNKFLVSDDTVPNGFTESIDELTGEHYRANPNLPYDSDLNLFSVERPYWDPAPPFRNIGDLFNVALPMDLDNKTGAPSPDDSVRLFESVDGPSGPVSTSMPIAGAFRNTASLLSYTWGPIFQTDIDSRYNGTNAPGISSTDVLPAYRATPNLLRDADGNYNSDWAIQQQYRLFSADDFRWISPYLTTRSYVYRVESRGIVRVQAVQQYGQSMDITSDKFWIVNMGDEAVVNHCDDGGDYDGAVPYGTGMGTLSRDWLNLAGGQGDLNRQKRAHSYTVLAYQEQPENGVPLSRSNFLPQ